MATFKKTKLKNLTVRDKILKDYIKVLLKNKFKVYAPLRKDEAVTYIHIEKNKNIGYIQGDSYRGLNFTTLHKPNRETGTGYRMHTEIYEPTIKHAESTFAHHPYWARKSEIPSIKKWGSFKEYATSSYGSWQKYQQVVL